MSLARAVQSSSSAHSSCVNVTLQAVDK